MAARSIATIRHQVTGCRSFWRVKRCDRSSSVQLGIGDMPIPSFDHAEADLSRGWYAARGMSTLVSRTSQCRALRNGTVWIDHSLAFRSRERLFIPAETWQKERNSYYRRLALPKRAESYLEPLIE